MCMCVCVSLQSHEYIHNSDVPKHKYIQESLSQVRQISQLHTGTKDIWKMYGSLQLNLHPTYICLLAIDVSLVVNVCVNLYRISVCVCNTVNLCGSVCDDTKPITAWPQVQPERSLKYRPSLKESHFFMICCQLTESVNMRTTSIISKLGLPPCNDQYTQGFILKSLGRISSPSYYDDFITTKCVPCNKCTQKLTQKLYLRDGYCRSFSILGNLSSTASLNLNCRLSYFSCRHSLAVETCHLLGPIAIPSIFTNRFLVASVHQRR